MQVKPQRSVDTSGQVCPQPMLAARRAIRTMQQGEVLELIGTDVGSRMDIPLWCERTGNELLRADDGGKVFRYLIRKGRDTKR